MRIENEDSLLFSIFIFHLIFQFTVTEYETCIS